MPARLPAPRLPPARSSGFTHGCPELLRVARAGSRRSRPALPGPARRGREGGGVVVVVEGGRRGRGSSALGSATLPHRANPSPLSPSPMPRPPLSSTSRACVLGVVMRKQFLDQT